MAVKYLDNAGTQYLVNKIKAIDGKNLSDKPSINNATLTIQKNGSTVKTFTANASSNVTCNITVPTKTSDITNDSNFVPSSDLVALTDAEIDAMFTNGSGS